MSTHIANVKHLTICRHAKSSWKFDTDDIYRPLNKRGIDNGPRMAAQLRAETPDHILCSPANRAYATALAYIWENQWPFSKLTITPSLFEASTKALTDVIKALDDSYVHVWLFGHNPGLSGLASFLCHEANQNLVTGGRISLQLNISQWQTLEENCGLVVESLSPHDLSE